ncbi:tyrosine-type recombinase/integrase [Persicimonas caeni]|nr:site-specific integrase [Persicimonas caeni]
MTSYQNIKELEDGRYQIRFRYTDPLTGKLKNVRRHFDGTLREAIAERDRLKVAARNGELYRSETVSNRATVDDLFPRWKEHRRNRAGRRTRSLAPSTLDTQHSILERHMLPDMGDWIVAEIQLHHLERMTDEWAMATKKNGELYSPATVNSWIRAAKVFLKWAFKRVGRNTHIVDDWSKLPQPEKTKGRSLDPEQSRKLLAAMKAECPKWYPLTLVLLVTGQRFSTVSALEWEDLDREKGYIDFNKSQVLGEVRRGSKTGQILRLPVPDRVFEVLEEHRAYMREKKHPGLRTGLVFPAKIDPDKAVNDGYMTPASLHKPLNKGCEKAGIPRVSPHDLRRTFNSLALEAGLSAHLLRTITGHTEEMTDHYYHDTKEGRQQITDAICGELLPAE